MAIPPEFEKWKRGKDDFNENAGKLPDPAKHHHAKHLPPGGGVKDKPPLMEGAMEKMPKPKHEEIKRGHQFHHGHGRKPNPRGMD